VRSRHRQSTSADALMQGAPLNVPVELGQAGRVGLCLQRGGGSVDADDDASAVIVAEADQRAVHGLSMEIPGRVVHGIAA
jgi:hypothetical protein